MLNYMLHYMLNYIQLYALHGIKFPESMITVRSRASCAAFHTQGAPLLKRRWCSRSLLPAAMIDEGLALEDPSQLPRTWKHRAGVSKHNPKKDTRTNTAPTQRKAPSGKSIYA